MPARTLPGTIRLVRWTVTSGSNSQSRGAVVLASGDHQWESAAEGGGPIAALFGAVDTALEEILAGHPNLVAFDIHALAESIDAEGLVTLAIEPPSGAAGARASGRYAGEARHVNIIAASIDAYLGAVNALLAESHWAGAAEAAGNRRRAAARDDAQEAATRARLDDEADHHDTTSWFDR